MTTIEKKLIQLTKNIYYFPVSTNIGVLASPQKSGETSIYLVESGNDSESVKKILKALSETFDNPVIKAVLNTHSHADHCGGNNFLKEQTGCKIMTSRGEAAIMECPDIEIGLIWGGNPVKELKTTYFVAESCKVDTTFENGSSFDLDIFHIDTIRLNGHYIDQTGFVVTDTDGKKVCFAGDALSGRNVISRYWIQYLYDEQRTKDSLNDLSKVKADFYVPGHGQGVSSIEGLCELNQLALLETENLILDELKTPKTHEQILKAVADRNGINLALSQYVLIGCTLRSYLSSLSDAGKIKFEIKDNMMYWSLK